MLAIMVELRKSQFVEGADGCRQCRGIISGLICTWTHSKVDYRRKYVEH